MCKLKPVSKNFLEEARRFFQRTMVPIVIGVVLVISGSAFWLFPNWIAAFGAGSPANSNQVENLTRDILIKSMQVIGGFALVVTAYFSWRDLQNSKPKPITGRFSKAVKQLSSKKLEVQLGGIYSLEYIARESPTDYNTIIKVLTAFIRSRAPFPDNSREQLIKQFSWANGGPKTKIYQCQGVTKNVQAALTVIGRRNTDLQNVKLDLSNTNLSQANLRKANLKKANFYGAVLSQADFRGADLKEACLLLAILSGGPKNGAIPNKSGAQMTRFDHANLSQANLMGAFMSYQVSFKGADLSLTNLTDTQVEGVFFHNANLQKADFSRANLQDAIFRMANLSDAVLISANLRGTDFRGVKNLTVEQVKSAQHWEQASYDSAFKRKLGLR